MKITIELDPSDEEDAAALDRLLNRSSVLDMGKEIGKLASKLGKQIGDQKKLTPSEKAQVAATARWSKKGKKRHVTPPIPSRREKEQDFSKAVEIPAEGFPTEPGQDFGLPEAPPWPDGREIIEGTFALPPPEDKPDERPRPVTDVIEP